MVIGIDASRAFVSEKTGTESYSYNVIKHLLRLPESNQHYFILFTRPNTVLPGWVKQNNVQIRQIKLPYLWTQVGLAITTWQKFKIQNSKFKLDILWIPAHTLPVLRKFGLVTLVTIHGLEYRWLPEYRNLLQRWYLPLSTYYAIRSSTRLIAVSHSTRNDILSEVKTDSKKIKVVWEGVEDKSEIRNPKSEKIWDRYGLSASKYVLFVGTIQPRKNLVSLIQAWGVIARELPDYKLVIAGAVGWQAEEVLKAPDKSGVSESVVFTGCVDSLVLLALYQGARVYVQPSWTEGFGLPIFEAMANGVVVVSSNGGALPEVVGQAGVIVALDDSFVGQLAKAIKGLILSKKRRENLIVRGYKRVKEFSWEKTAKETLLCLLGEGYSRN